MITILSESSIICWSLYIRSLLKLFVPCKALTSLLFVEFVSSLILVSKDDILSNGCLAEFSVITIQVLSCVIRWFFESSQPSLGFLIRRSWAFRFNEGGCSPLIVKTIYFCSVCLDCITASCARLALATFVKCSGQPLSTACLTL